MADTDYKLDFLCVGFTKCGTTSLHHYLKGHPGINLPYDKESPFFDVSLVNAGTWSQYFLKSYPLRKGLLHGKVTPRYTASPKTPGKIHSLFPDVKIVFLVRNPVSRLFSYFKMMKRLGRFQGSFMDFINHQLAIDTGGETYSPIQQGLYFRIISGFKEYFPAEQMLVEFTDDMERNPKDFLKRVLRFLQLDDSYTPQDLNKKYYEGSSQSRYPKLTGNLTKNRLLKVFWHLFPYPIRMKMVAWYYTEFNIVKAGSEAIPEEASHLLYDYYKDDVAQLEKLLNSRVPWQSFHGRES